MPHPYPPTPTPAPAPSRVLVGILAVFFAALPTVAQDSPAAASPLAGPSVAAAAPAKPTLIQRNFAGKLVRLEVPPAEAAVQALELDPPTREKVDAILLARSAILDQIVADNLQLLAKLQGARELTDKTQARETVQELFEKSEPLRARGKLIDELSDVLTTEQSAQVRSMTEDYVRAAIAERVADKTGGKDLSFREKGRVQREATREETVAMIGHEIRRAYDRTIGQRSTDFDKLLKDFNVTPEQESKIRKIVQDNFTATYGKPTPQQRTKAFWDVYAVLDQSQREQFVRRLGEERAASRAK